ncbi:hypothetical protein [Brevibacterium jeotgali]|uniref:PIN domain-containing protein n=1 Tax=Brevibacterium jeotgali TaxID=1262550 RepID=A0A2H1L4A4_9MICO|nr:hypothetical protein [Brevibacterium jeotgali]TWB98678.1 hypothetical protein FB108_2573 [Brevibacterium jeotgali]SMY11722.1 hypothetical protein BJEO58_01309 [Brevibacterium jeotgali]
MPDTQPDPIPAASAPQLPSDAPRVLIDTSVLAPEPLWLWMLALTDGAPDATRPLLGVSRGVTRELRHALRRIDPRLTRAQADRAARLRTDSLTRLDEEPAGHAAHQRTDAAVRPSVRKTAHQPARPHVLDPDDAHLDAAALAWGADLLVTDDVHAFAPLPAEERGYALLTADEFLCTLVDTSGLSVAEALLRYQHRLSRVLEETGAEASAGSPSHRLRRSRAHRFARRVVRAQRAAADAPGPSRRPAG